MEIYLIGFSIKGKVITKPGHTHNTNFIKIRVNTKRYENNNTQLILTKNLLQQRTNYKDTYRDPFLFIDEIRDLYDDFTVGSNLQKHDYFRGHFK